MKRFLLLAVFVAAGADAQQLSPDSAARLARTRDSLFRAHSFPLGFHNGKLSGAGHDFLMRELAGTQFVAVGERHGIREIPLISLALLRDLHSRFSYQHLAVENGSRLTDDLFATLSSRNLDSVVAYARKYPNAFAFNSDQDLELVAAAASELDSRASTVWGLDQEFGATHLFDQLRKHPAPQAARLLLDSIAAAASAAERTRFDKGGVHWMAVDARPEMFARLRALYGTLANADVVEIVRALEESAILYDYNRRAGKGELTGFAANADREEIMKRAFMKRYNAAVASGERHPKVMLKMGQAHLGRGQSPFGPFSVGNLVSELATVNGTKSFHIAVLAHNARADSTAPSMWGWSAMVPVASAVPPDKCTIIDLRPLRPFLYSGRLGPVEADLRRMIYGFDALILVGGATRATENLTSAAEQRAAR